MQIRRVVTGHSGKKSVIVADGPAPKAFVSSIIPASSTAMLWATSPSPSVPHSGQEAISANTSTTPGAGETRLVVVTFPPESAFMNPNIDLQAYGRESAAFDPDFMRHFEPDNPGMHTTDTVDYGFVLKGEISLEVDDGQLVHLKAGDIVVQNGTRHAWRNRSAEPASIAFVLIGANRRSSL